MGKLVCFSGLDGSGKTTQALSLNNWLNSKNVDSVVYHTKNLEFNKNDVVIKTMIFQKKNKLHLSSEKLKGIYAAFTFDDIITNTVVPDLQKHDVVIIDRYLETQYFIYKLKKIDSEYSEGILDHIKQPDLNIFIDVKPEDCYERIISRSEKIMEHETLENLKKAYHYYHDEKEKFFLHMLNGNRRIDEIENDVKRLYQEEIGIVQ